MKRIRFEKTLIQFLLQSLTSSNRIVVPLHPIAELFHNDEVVTRS
ncbi:hypothetical protein [Lysinibacillus sp. PWR01]